MYICMCTHFYIYICIGMCIYLYTYVRVCVRMCVLHKLEGREAIRRPAVWSLVPAPTIGRTSRARSRKFWPGRAMYGFPAVFSLSLYGSGF